MTIRTLPLSTNRLYRGRRFLTPEGKTNKEALAWEMRVQWRGKPLVGPLRLDIALYWPDGRRHDLDNIKGLLDAFTGILYEDDSQIEELRIRKGIDRANPRVEITSFSLNEGDCPSRLRPSPKSQKRTPPATSPSLSP